MIGVSPGWRFALGAGGVCIALAACGASGPHSRIEVTPAAGLADRARTIVVSGLRPHDLVAVSARSVFPGSVWSAAASFRADRRGVVDLASSAPLSGSYRGASAMGLFWSEHWARGLRYRVSPFSGPWYRTTTRLTVTARGTRLATASVTQTLLAPGVQLREERLSRNGFGGIYFAPKAHANRRPAVVVWGGSEGGIETGASWAALLASHGFPALALAYFREPGLPSHLSNIPLEYFVRAIRWLGVQAGVDAARLWLMAVSRGSEAELLVASHWPGLVHGLVAASPSAFVYPGLGCLLPYSCHAWTLAGRPLPAAHVGFGTATYEHDGAISELSAFRAGLADKAADRGARIPIGRFRGPVCLISGGNDQLWPSNYYADQIMAELRQDPAAHVHLNYPHAGHLVFDIPYQPTTTKSKLSDITLDLGGTIAANETAHQHDWPFTLKFIATH